jgi:hypothetical protein
LNRIVRSFVSIVSSMTAETRQKSDYCTRKSPQFQLTQSAKSSTIFVQSSFKLFFNVDPQRQFREFCSDLMNNAIPEGVDGTYDFFNFCCGVWIYTSCDYPGNCGTLDCDNKTATGTLNGKVFGCTVTDVFKLAPSDGSHNSKRSSTSGIGGTTLF